MRRHLGEHLRRIPLQILYRQRSGELNALLAGTIDETYNHTLIVSNMLIAAVFTPLATALLTLIWDWRLGLILLISFPLIVSIQHGTQPLMARAKARLARANASLNSATAAAAKPPSSASSCATPTRSRGASSSAAATSAP